MTTHPALPLFIKVQLPKGVVVCPLCGKHYIIDGHEKFRVCKQIAETDSLPDLIKD